DRGTLALVGFEGSAEFIESFADAVEGELFVSLAGGACTVGIEEAQDFRLCEDGGASEGFGRSRVSVDLRRTAVVGAHEERENFAADKEVGCVVARFPWEVVLRSAGEGQNVSRAFAHTSLQTHARECRGRSENAQELASIDAGARRLGGPFGEFVLIGCALVAASQ